MVLQYVIQTYLCAYLTERETIRDLVDTYWYTFYVFVALWLTCVALASAFAVQFKGRAGLYLPLYFFLTIIQMAVFVIAGINFLPTKATTIFSAMQTCCYLALSLYSCCLKSKFTVLWSHISFAILLVAALGISIAMYVENYVYTFVGCVAVAAWASLVTLNSMAIHDSVGKTEGFYAAVRA